MLFFNYTIKNKKVVLALGPESAGNFSVYFSGKIFFSKDFGDLLDEKNYKNFQKSALDFLKKYKIKPDVILTDLHPLYKTTAWGQILAKKFKAKHIQVQHHIAHIFSAVGDKIIQNSKFQPEADQPLVGKIQNSFLGIACDGTGYGADGKIWGGEIFKISNFQFLISNKIQNYPKAEQARYGAGNAKRKIERIAHLENQTMIGGDLAVKEPARMLIAILSKTKNQKPKTKNTDQKSKIYGFVKKFYTRNQFELLYSQLQQNFNCLETSSAGRVLDAVSLLLGFCQNKRNYKHEPIKLLENNSAIPYQIKPKIQLIKENTETISNFQFLISNKMSNVKCQMSNVLQTTPLFEYLIKNLHKDKKRLAATAQLYIARGLCEIIKKLKAKSYNLKAVFFAGGIANNKIISNYLESKGVYANKKIPRGDAGLSFGQIFWYLLS